MLIVTRPEDDADALAGRLAGLGHRAIVAPLMAVRFLDGAEVPPLAFQAVLVTSANGARALARHPALFRLKEGIAVAVGETSAAAARAAGFARVLVAGGDVAALIATVKAALSRGGGPLLHASGAETTGDVVGTLARAGYSVHRAVLYEAVAAEALPEAARAALAAGTADGVLLYSPRTARLWCRLVREAGLTDRLAGLRHYCLSANVATALAEEGCGAAPARIAERPAEDALLSLIADDHS
jgi:uroporphyrinogen-III synthase